MSSSTTKGIDTHALCVHSCINFYNAQRTETSVINIQPQTLHQPKLGGNRKVQFALNSELQVNIGYSTITNGISNLYYECECEAQVV